MTDLNHKRYIISSGIGSGKTRLVSFDHALLCAGVGNYNLVRLSSILPLAAEEAEAIDLPLGSLLPIAYAVQSTNVPGRQIAAAIAVGFPVNRDESHCAVIMEYEAECSAQKASAVVKQMIAEAFEKRGWDIERMQVRAEEAYGPKDGSYATAFACLAEWDE